jgi:hypothetical protein
MSKDETIKKIESVMIHAVYGVSSPASYKKAKAIYNAGFRDVGDVKNWLDEKWNFDYNDAWYLALEPVDKGKVQMARAVLDRLREL